MKNQLLRINLTTNKISKEPIPEEVYTKYIGGTGFISYYLYKEIQKKIDPLGPDNKLIIVSGPAQGTRIPITGRNAKTWDWIKTYSNSRKA